MAGRARTATAEVGHRYASLEARAVAYILDIVVLVSCLMLFIAVAGLQLLFRSDFGDLDPPESAYYVALGIFLSYFAFVPLYYILLWAWQGQTVGKMAVHIKVVRREDGGPLGLGQAGLRFLGYLASTLPLFAGFLMAPFDKERRALHDHLAGSVVIDVP